MLAFVIFIFKQNLTFGPNLLYLALLFWHNLSKEVLVCNENIV